MGDAVRVLTSELYSVLPQKASPTVKLILEGDHGKAYQSHGAYFEFTATTLALAEYQVAAYATRIISKCASKQFAEFGNDAIWEKILRELGVVNFHGNWHADLLKCIIGKCPNLHSLCLTYINCYDLPLVLDTISSKVLYELVAHVGPGQQQRFLQQLSLSSAKLGFCLDRLMLIFSDPLKTKTIEEIQKILNNVLSAQADVILLFGGEKDCDIKELKLAQYLEDGKITMAKNALYDDEDGMKKYETYQCYRRITGNRKFKIGSLIGSSGHNEEHAQFQDVNNAMNVQASPTIALSTNLRDPEYEHTAPLLLPQNLYIQKLGMEHYKDEDVPQIGKKPNGGNEGMINAFNFPGWPTTKIQKVIYHEFLTEYLTSTGLFFRLRSMKDEPGFHRSMLGIKRIVIDCRTHLRLNILKEAIEYLLRNSNHVEFTGDWNIRTLQAFISGMNPNIEKLTMMQISLQRTDPIRVVFNHMQPEVLQSIKFIHIDARDSPVDLSMGSIYNALRENFSDVEEFVCIANRWAQPKFKCDFKKFLDDLAGLVKPNGSAVIVVIKSTISIQHIFDAGFSRTTSAVAVYPCYQRQGHINPSAPIIPDRPHDTCKLMMQFYKCHLSRNIYVTVPWNHEYAKIEKENGGQRWSCEYPKY